MSTPKNIKGKLSNEMYGLRGWRNLTRGPSSDLRKRARRCQSKSRPRTQPLTRWPAGKIARFATVRGLPSIIQTRRILARATKSAGGRPEKGTAMIDKILLLGTLAVLVVPLGCLLLPFALFLSEGERYTSGRLRLFRPAFILCLKGF